MNVTANEHITASGDVAKAPRIKCEYCEVYVPKNVYSRNHGDKCSYKDSLPGTKYCRCCNELIPIEGFATVSVRTFDGRNATCNVCLGKKYYKPVVIKRGKNE